MGRLTDVPQDASTLFPLLLPLDHLFLLVVDELLAKLDQAKNLRPNKAKHRVSIIAAFSVKLFIHAPDLVGSQIVLGRHEAETLLLMHLNLLLERLVHDSRLLTIFLELFETPRTIFLIYPHLLRHWWVHTFFKVIFRPTIGSLVLWPHSSSISCIL